MCPPRDRSSCLACNCSSSLTCLSFFHAVEEAQRREGGTRPPEGGGTQCRQCSCLHVSQRLSHSRHSRSTVVQTSRVSDTGNISSPLQLGGNFEHPRRQRRAWLASLPNDLQSILLLVMTVTGQHASPLQPLFETRCNRIVRLFARTLDWHRMHVRATAACHWQRTPAEHAHGRGGELMHVRGIRDRSGAATCMVAAVAAVPASITIATACEDHDRERGHPCS